jgi:hypothetical protein
VLKMTSVDKIIPFYPTAAAAIQGM